MMPTSIRKTFFDIKNNNKSCYFRLEGVDSPDSQYRWRWFDTTSPGHFREEETNGTVNKINYTIVYPSSEVCNLLLCLLNNYLSINSVSFQCLRDDIINL